MGIPRNVDVLMSTIADGPAVVGWLRPLILLPASSLLGLSPQQLEAVIAHELAHIRRHDYLVSAAQVVVETLLFYHPAVWWTSSRIRHERELCCDDLAVRACGDAVCYARALTKLEKLRVVKPNLVLGGTDGGLLYRIQRIIGEKTMEYGPSKLSGVFVLFLALAGLAVNLTWIHAEPGPQEKAVNQTTEQTNGVSVNLGSTSVIHRTNVEYPEAALKQGIQGTVSLEVTLDSTGNVADARVLSGPTELRRAALQSVLQWHFVPDGAQATRAVHLTFDLAQGQKALEGRGFSFNLVDGQAGYVTLSVDKARALEEQKVRERLMEGLSPQSLEKEAQVKRQLEIGLSQAQLENEKAELVSQRARQEDTLAFLLRELANADGEERAEIEKKIENYGKDMSALSLAQRQEIEKAQTVRLQAQADMKRVPLEGQTLAAIRIDGLSEDARQTLMSRLPVRVGDTLTHESLEGITDAIHKFDEHLEHSFSFSPDRNTIELRIVAPGSGNALRKIAVPSTIKRP